MLIYAHRGSSGSAPENTRLAFEQAIADGADGVELDVRATVEGIPVVLHDRDVARTTNGTGSVDELSLATLRTFDAGQGQRVPTLAETLDVLAGRLRLDLEIKQPGIEEAVLDVLAGYPHADWAISSFDWSSLARFRTLAPDAELWLLATIPSDAAFTAAHGLGAAALALHAAAVTPDVARRCFTADLDLVVWTVNRIEDARLARLHGVAAICTDVPGPIRRGLAGQRPH